MDIPSREEAARIAAFLALEAPPAQADLAFVFGSQYPDPAYISADLVERDRVRYVVLTGGNKRTGADEALAHQRILLREGVPYDRMIVESSSTNTLENVTLALPAIAARIDLQCIEAIVVVAKWYHCRRAAMTLRRHLPPGIRYYTITYEPEGFARRDWHLDAAIARRVRKEIQAIPRYLELGHIAEIRRDGDAFV